MYFIMHVILVAVFCTVFAAVLTEDPEIIAPIFLNTPEMINVTKGERATIPCNATGKPNPTFSWIKGAAKKNITTSLSHDGRLNIDPVTEEDDNVFICVASNSARTVQHKIKVNVQSKPRIVEIVNSTILRGESGELTCFVYGNPLPNITIRKLDSHSDAIDPTNVTLPYNNLEIDSKVDSKGRLNTIKAVLKLDNVTWSDSGLYKCSAWNGMGETASNLHLTVESKPYFLESTMLKNVITWGNRIVMLSCLVEAIPDANITWYYGNNTTPLGEVGDLGYAVRPFAYGSFLHIMQSNKRQEVFGVYTCRAVNKHGEATYEIKLEKGSVPYLIGVYIDSITATSIGFKFFNPLNSPKVNPPITAYIVQYCMSTAQSAVNWNSFTSNQIFWPVGGPYTIDSLIPGTRYLFRFQGVNDVGKSSWGAVLDAETLPLM